MKAKVTPQTVTLREKEEHNRQGHVIFRSWCPTCVESRGFVQHPSLEHQEDELAQVGMDYFFVGSKGDPDGTLTCLNVYNSKYKQFNPTVVLSKGAEQQYPVKPVVESW